MIATAALIGLVVVIAVLAALLRRVSADAPPPALYVDDGRTSRPFESARHRLRAKPDRLERGDDGTVTLVELKSRARGVHASDRAQIVATALAVRAAGIDVTRARLETREGEPVVIDLRASDDALFERIRPAVDAARLAMRGIAPDPTPSNARCRACGYRAVCPYRGDRP